MSNMDPRLQLINGDLMSFCHFLNSLSNPPKLVPSDFEDALISLSYRLLYLHPLGYGAALDPVSNAYHLGSVALLWTIMFESGRLHRSRYSLLANRIQNAVDLLIAVGSDTSLLVLWLLLLGGISVMRHDDKSWLYERVRSCIGVPGLENWQDARKLLANLPWIHLIHDKPAEKLWHEAVT